MLSLCIICIHSPIIVIKEKFAKTFNKTKEGFNASGFLGFHGLPDLHLNTVSDQNNKIENIDVTKDCYAQSSAIQCLQCGQCGISVKNGISKCVPGDVNGPAFQDDAQEWIYGNSYDKYLYGENVVRRYKPWNRDVKQNIPDLLGLFY